MKEKSGSLFGGALLITGSCVGAGMLGLPILTGLSGFFPALLMFTIAWAFMTLTGLLLVEANGRFVGTVNFSSIVGKTLGTFGKAVCSITYLFLFYSLLVAYVSAGGSLCSGFLSELLGFPVSSSAAAVLFILLFGGVVVRGTRQVDLWNRVLMAGKILFFFSLVFVAAKAVTPSFLWRADLSETLFSLPILIISFGFHNMIPVLTDYMKGDTKKVKQAILLGGLLAFAVYVIWEMLILGIVPLEGPGGLVDALQNDREGSQALASTVSSTGIDFFARGLAFFAILTSFLAQALSLVHFLADGFRIPSSKQGNLIASGAALLPPLAVALVNPDLFFTALDFAGGICAVLLFGILPVLIVFVGRKNKNRSSYTVSGGLPVLLSIALFSLFIFVFEILLLAGVYKLPGRS